VQIQAEPRRLPCRCPACGIRVKVTARALNRDPAYQDAIAAGNPGAKPPRTTGDDERIPCLIRLLRRIRRRRGDVGPSIEPREYQHRSAIGWLLFFCTWLPVVVCVSSFVLLPVVACLAILYPAIEVDEVLQLTLVAVFAASFLGLGVGALWYRYRRSGAGSSADWS
jgi:hypothetical protein